LTPSVLIKLEELLEIPEVPLKNIFGEVPCPTELKLMAAFAFEPALIFKSILPVGLHKIFCRD
jgi:hypothetical protein